MTSAEGPINHSETCGPELFKSATQAGVELLAAIAYDIIMVTLWVLPVKCKAQGNTKEAILCKYSRQEHSTKTACVQRRLRLTGELILQLVQPNDEVNWPNDQVSWPNDQVNAQVNRSRSHSPHDPNDCWSGSNDCPGEAPTTATIDGQAPTTALQLVFIIRIRQDKK
jgi:hypothetical protein